MSYYTESLKPSSEKITLVTAEAVERLKLFTSSGVNWTRSVEHFVVGVKDNGTVINSWAFNPLSKTLTIIGGTNPKTRNISVTYRFFFSNAPINLPYDLSTGEVVEWEPYILSIGAVGQRLDSENTGIILESSSNVDFINTDSRFQDIIDTLIWENQTIKFYSMLGNIQVSEAIQLFSGVVESKAYSESKISFKVKDFVFKLKNKVNLGLFSDIDGVLLPSIVGTAKRRIYGQADFVKTASLDATLDGYALTGTLSGTVNLFVVTGTGTLFLDQLSVGDELFFTSNGTEYKFGIEAIASNTSLTVSSALPISFQNAALKNKPATPWRKRNRSWHLAGHKISSPTSEIINVISLNRFEVDTTVNMFSDDEIEINGVSSTIRRVSGNIIVTSTNISPIPINGDLIVKRAIRNVYYSSRRLEYIRDYTFTSVTETIINLEELAEFNITEQRVLNVNLLFTSGSRSITTSETVDLTATFKPRDWIRAKGVTNPTWYEVIQVSPQSLIIRLPFGFSTTTDTVYYKNIDAIDENSLITSSCLGIDVNGDWMRTASDSIRHLVLNDAEFPIVNEASFLKAKNDCDYTISLVVPPSLGQGYPIIRDVISNINESVLAVLYGSSSQDISYSVFNTRKPESLQVIDDSDILSFSVDSSQKIINDARISYAPYIDIYSEEDTFKVITRTSNFVNNLIGIKASTEKTLYLYNEADADIMTQRTLFFRSLSNSIINIKGKMNFSSINVNDKLYISLDRLFKRYSSNDSRRVGVVSGVSKNGFGVDIYLSDLSNCFNRVMCIASNSTLDFLNASVDDKVSFCFLVDNFTETPNPLSENGLGSNLIG